MISGAILAGSSGYSSPTNPNIYIGAFDNTGMMVNGTMVSALGTYVFSVPGIPYLGQQLNIRVIWDADGSTNPLTDPMPPMPTPSDWWGGYGGNPITVQVASNNAIDIPLTNEFVTVAGTVTRAEGGELIPNLEINVRKDNPCESDMPLAWTQTDAIGNYSLTLPAGFSYYLFANSSLMFPSQDLAPEWYTSTGGTFYCVETEAITPTENTFGKNFALANGGTISGTLKNNAGIVLSGVTVETWNDALAQGWQQKVTDLSGNFTFSDLSQGPWEIRIQLDPTMYNYVHYVREDWLNAGENKNIGTITSQQGALVTGTFKDSTANPIPYLEYWYGGKFEIGWGNAAGDGTFAFRLPLGTYYLNLDPMDRGYTILPKEIQVSDVGATYPQGVLTAYDDATGDHISGTVTDSAFHWGQFQVMAFLSSQPFTPENFGAVAVLGAGQPPLGGGSYAMFVPPDQTVNVALALFVVNEKSLESMTVVSTPYSNLNMAVLGPSLSGINFLYNDPGYTVDGFVKSASTPPYRTSVMLYKQPGDQFAGFADSDETGYYTFYNVPAGDYKIAVTHPLYPNQTPWSSQFTVSADMTVADIFIGGQPPKDEIVLDFGTAYGLYYWNQPTGWAPWNSADPNSLLAVDIDNDGLDELVASFNGYGLYTYEPSTEAWNRITGVVPEAMIAINSAN
jgi:hypothetical protein